MLLTFLKHGIHEVHLQILSHISSYTAKIDMKRILEFDNVWSKCEIEENKLKNNNFRNSKILVPRTKFAKTETNVNGY